MSKFVYVFVLVLVLVAAFALPTNVYAGSGVDTVNQEPAAVKTIFGYKGNNGYFQCPSEWGTGNKLVGANVTGACFYRGNSSVFGVDPSTAPRPTPAPSNVGSAISTTAIGDNPVHSAYWSFFCSIGSCNTK